MYRAMSNQVNTTFEVNLRGDAVQKADAESFDFARFIALGP